MYACLPAHRPWCVREAAPWIRPAARAVASRAAELSWQPPQVLTWLTPGERLYAEASGKGTCRFAHCGTLQATRHALLEGRADAVLVSAALLDVYAVSELGAVVAQFPAVPFAGLVTEPDRARAVLGAQRLGHAGVRILIDSRARGGWGILRETLDQPHVPEPFLRDALTAVLADLEKDESGIVVPCTEGCRRFFQAILAPAPGTADELARRLGVPPTTLTSRFVRAGLPSPKQYLSAAQLVRAARLGESPVLTVQAIAARLGVSTGQSLNRMLRHRLGTTVTEFRGRFTGRQMLDRFRETLVLPYRATLRTFDPVLGRAARPHRVGTCGAGEEAAPCE